jgi:hypothetical protein
VLALILAVIFVIAAAVGIFVASWPHCCQL